MWRKKVKFPSRLIYDQRKNLKKRNIEETVYISREAVNSDFFRA